MTTFSTASKISLTNDQYVKVIEYDVDSNPVYVGKAVPGSAKSGALWQIQKLTYSGGNVTDVQFAGGKPTFSFVWNDRASYSYS